MDFEPVKIDLTHPIQIRGQDVDHITIRHALRVGDLAACQRYARREGLTEPIDVLLDTGDLGAIMALLESMCQLPPGTLDLLHPDDLDTVLEAATPFLSDSP